MKTLLTKAPRLTRLVPAWEGMRKTIPDFGPIRNERDYGRMQALLDELLAVVGDNEDHPLGDLLEIIGTLIEQYEDHRYPIDPAEPRELLQFLMKEHRLKQADLEKELESQGVVSEILSGKRAINARQAKALAKRFGLSPDLFI